MRQMFVLRVKDKEGELKKSEKEVKIKKNLQLQELTEKILAPLNLTEKSGSDFIQNLDVYDL